MAMMYRIAFFAACGLFLCSPGWAQTKQCPAQRDFRSQDKIVGGRDAKVQNWPGQAVLRQNNHQGRILYFCGGTLVSPDTVLTAAHCVHDFERTAEGHYTLHGVAVEVLLNKEDLKQAPFNVRSIKEVVVHERYTSTDKGDDIALIRLADSQEEPAARLALSANADPTDSGTTPLMVAGFGTQQSGGGLNAYIADNGEPFQAGSDKLLETVVPLVSPKACSDAYPNAVIGAGQICAGFVAGGKDSCQGDSGGPLVAFDQSGCPYQVGVVSWGAGCARPNAFGVYTRVSAYADWIRGKVTKVAAVEDRDLAAAANPGNDLVAAVFSQLNDVLGNAKGKTDITISAGPKVRVGDLGVFHLTTRVAGRPIIIDINSKGEVTQLYPNQYTSAKRIDSGRTLTVPDSQAYRFPVKEPLGSSRLVAIIVPDNFDLNALEQAKGSKGFTVEAGLSYLQNLIQLLRNAQGAKGFGVEGDGGVSGWGLGDFAYDVVR